jgi:hypothetical protein
MRRFFLIMCVSQYMSWKAAFITSVLSFQRRLQRPHAIQQFNTMFTVQDIPSDAELRKTIDPIDTENINPCFAILFEHLQQGKQLLPYNWKAVVT